MSQTPATKIQWHHIFADFLSELLEPVGIKVKADVPISQQPPKIDVILLQQSASAHWTAEQQRFLPDGIRDSLANHVPIELKYTEIADGQAIRQTLMYDIGYHRSYERNTDIVIQSFLVSSMTPDKNVIAAFGYQPSDKSGVYRSDNIFVREIPIIVLNELSHEPHNVFFKLFASRQTTKRAAVAGLKQWWMNWLPESFFWLIQGLLKLWLQGEQLMETITTETLREQGKQIKELILPLLADEQLAAMLEDTGYIQRIQARGEEIGLAKGKQEAERHTWQLMFKNIRQTLAIRFTIDLEQYDQALQFLDLPTMEKLNELAFTVKTLAEFEAELEPLKPPPATAETA